MAEQRPCKALRAGSSPATGSSVNPVWIQCGGRTQMARGQAVNLLLAGSIPVVHPKFVLHLEYD